jgi:phosphate/sulfate permease
VVYSRTYVMYLVPLAILFSLVWLAAAIYLAFGIARSDGEAIIGGVIGTVLFLPLLAIGWKNALSALRDRRIQKRQLR